MFNPWIKDVFMYFKTKQVYHVECYSSDLYWPKKKKKKKRKKEEEEKKKATQNICSFHIFNVTTTYNALSNQLLMTLKSYNIL